MISKGVNGKVSDIAQFTPASNRTSISRCLSSDYWNEKLLEIALKTCVVKLIWTSTKEAKQPIYFIINYTISENTKSSSKDINLIGK